MFSFFLLDQQSQECYLKASGVSCRLMQMLCLFEIAPNSFPILHLTTSCSKIQNVFMWPINLLAIIKPCLLFSTPKIITFITGGCSQILGPKQMFSPKTSVEGYEQGLKFLAAHNVVVVWQVINYLKAISYSIRQTYRLV